MAVPDTTTFSLQDVVDNVTPTTNDLVDCVADAIGGSYDVAYYTTPATSLLEFRNYGAVTLLWRIGDITSGTTKNISALISGGSQAAAVQPNVDPGGTRLYVPRYGNKRIRQLSIATANDLSSTVAAVGLSSALSYFFTSIQISSDGLRMIVLDDPGDSIREYALSTAWDITTMSTTATTSISVPTPNTVNRNLAFSYDGKRMFMIRHNSTTYYIVEWALTTGWDLSTAGSATSNDVTATIGAGPTSLFYLEESGQPIVVPAGGAGGDAYYNGITDSEWNHHDVTTSYQVFGSANDADHMYTLRRSGSSPAYVWTLTQWDTNV